MTDARMNRRLGAMLSLRLEDTRLDEVSDARDPRGIRWSLGTLLPWKDLLWAVQVALLTTTAEQLEGLRPRQRAASP